MQNHTSLSPRDTLADIQIALKEAREPLLRTRLKAILLRKQDKTPQEIATQLIVSDRSVTGWVLRYNEGGMTALHTKQSGRPTGNPKWNGDIFDDLTKEIDKGGYWSVPRMQEWIKKHHQKSIPEQTV